MTALLDTSILIDYLRRFSLAELFLDNLSDQDENISVISSMEIIRGCQTKISLKLAKKFLKHFTVVPIDSKISSLAQSILETYRFNTNIDIPDAFIAATAIVKKQKFLTKNIKHFQDLYDLKVELPY